MPESGDRGVAAPQGRGYHTIGEVLNLLKPEFPDVSISKIRFLESRGLIAPERTKSGYRKFAAHDIQRLRFILTDQRDRYLPLKVIKERVQLWERGELEDETVDGPVTRDSTAERPDLARPLRPMKLDTAGMREETGLTREALEELETFGILRPDRSGGAPIYDESDLAIGEIALRFETYGIQARHLRIFRQAVDRERDLFDQALAPLLVQTGPDARARADKALSELAGLTRRLHEALLVQYLRDRSP